MKRLLPLLLCLGLFTHCRRDYRAFDIYFWSSDTSCGPLSVYLNRHYAGDLPRIGHHTEKETALLQQQALHRHLPSGRYRLEVFDSLGHIRYAGYLTVLRRPGNLSISTDVENTRIMTHGDVFLEEFYTKERPNS
jgi:hypothetical protein